MYPLGSCVLHGLGTYERLRAASTVLARYEMASAAGEVLQSFDMSVLTAGAGPLLMVSRSDLVEVLASSCTGADLRRGLTVASLDADPHGVDVVFGDGSTDRFDLVIGCDGIDSQVRRLAFGPPRRFDSGWVLWTWWVVGDAFAPDAATEWWCPGAFFGAYPAPGRVMCAAGGPADAVRGDDVRAVLRSRFAPVIARVRAVADALDRFEDGHPWPMADVRARTWVSNRVALCGDAAVGFMPTAGVGASNAMRAGAALADELSRADAGSVPLALELYEKRCRARVERNQTDSRRLARAMFVRSRVLAGVRDQIARRMPARWVLGGIIASAHQPF